MDMQDTSGVPLDPDRQRYWDERYAAEGDLWGLEPNRFVAAELGDFPPGRVLDLGSGQGRNAVWLAKKGNTVTAVDLSTVAVERARELAADNGVTIDAAVADLTEWEPEAEMYDLVLLSYLQFAAPLRARVHAMAQATVVRGGTVFLVAHHRANLEHGVGGPQVEELLFTESELAADFVGMEIVRLERVLRPVEGADRAAIDVVLRATKPKAAA